MYNISITVVKTKILTDVVRTIHCYTRGQVWSRYNFHSSFIHPPLCRHCTHILVHLTHTVPCTPGWFWILGREWVGFDLCSGKIPSICRWSLSDIIVVRLMVSNLSKRRNSYVYAQCRWLKYIYTWCWFDHISKGSSVRWWDWTYIRTWGWQVGVINSINI